MEVPPINGTAIGALVIFVLAVAGVVLLVLVRVPLGIPLPGGRKLSARVPHWAAPPAGVLLMLAAGALDGRGLLAGLKGDDAIQPYAILVLFFSLAYMALSLDQTGAFSWLALKMTRAAASGPRLFALHTLLAGAVTVATSNDVVVMSLTPIVYVQSAASGAEPLPFLATEFVSANLWSMALFIGNPTNIIVASAFNLTFLGYSKWMLAPTVAAGLAATAVIYLTHRRALPPRLALPDIPPALVLADPWGAVFLTANLAVCVALLAAAPTIRFPMWCITLACAGAACAYCACAYVLLPRARGAARRRKLHGVKSAAELLPHGGRPEVPSSSKHRGAVSGGEPPALAEASQTPSKDPESPTEVATAGDLDPPVTTPPPPPAAAAAAAAANLRTRLTSRRPTFWGPFLGVPWDVAPLVLGFFILVEGLQANGWVDRLGALLGGSARHVVPGLWCVGAVAVLLANLINNQPMTILLTRACLSPAFKAAATAGGAVAPAVARRNLQAALFAVVVGSNTAACFTVIGALAGIMWVAIVRQRGLKVGYLKFSSLMLPAGLAATVAALAVLTCEFAVAPIESG